MTDPARTRVVTFYEAPLHIVQSDIGASKPMNARPKTLSLPVLYTTEAGNDVVRLPNGNLLELP